MKHIFLFMCCFWLYSYSYSQSLVENCNNNYLPSCFSLLKQAETKKDVKNIDLYKMKMLNIMDSACKRDYQTCFVLARIYEPNKNNKLFQEIKKDLLNHKIPSQLTLSFNKQNLDSMYIHEDDIVKLIRIAPNETKSTSYKEKTISLLETACYKADVRACLLLHYFYEYGIAIAQNRPKAERLVELGLDFATRECVLENGEMCQIINKYPFYINDLKKDIGKIERKCYDDEDWVSCYKASLYYTKDFYINPNSTEQDNDSDFVKSAKLLQKACNFDEKTCSNVLFKLNNVKECIKDNNISACANTQNSRIEFLALACNGGNLRSCYEMRYIPTFKDTKKYIKLLQRVCRGGIIESCVELSNIYQDDKIVPRNKEKALSFMQRACSWSMKNKVSGDYCYHAGVGYENGEFVKQDLDKAIEAYQFACEISNKNAIACERLGMLYETYKQDMGFALNWYEKACKQSNHSMLSCMKLAEAYYEGKFLRFNPQQSIKIYEDLLKNKENGEVYYKLAQIYSNHSNNKQAYETNVSYVDYAKSMKFYNIACNLGVNSACNVNITLPNLTKECRMENLHSCYEVASIIELAQNDSTYEEYAKTLQTKEIINSILNDNKQNKPLAMGEQNKIVIYNLYSKACKGNIKQACLNIYNSKLQQDSNDVLLKEAMCLNLKDEVDVRSVCIDFAQYAINQEQYKKAIDALNKYKDKNSKQILELLAKAYFYDKDYNNVINIYKFIYKYKIPSDYYYLAQMYKQGLLVKQDYNIAQSIYKLSNTPNSYLGLGKMYEYGLGVSKSIFDAKGFYSLACPLESSDKNKIANEACISNGRLYGLEGDFKTSQKYYSKACDFGYEGDLISCNK